MLIAEKDEKLKSIATELERTQKILRLLNNGTSRLDHLITTGKSFGDHTSIGYKDESSRTKIMFIKFGLLTDTIDVSSNKSVIKSVAIEGKYAVQKSIVTSKSAKLSR